MNPAFDFGRCCRSCCGPHAVGLEFEMHRPRKLGPALVATEPWEAAGLYAYNTVLRVNATTYFM